MQSQNLTSFSSAGRAGRSSASAAGRPVVASLFHEIAAFIHAAFHLRSEMRRMADEFEGSRPEHAARLRKLADSNWSD